MGLEYSKWNSDKVKGAGMDPLTLITTSLVAGASAGLKPAAEQAIKDAYEGLKKLITRKYKDVSIGHLEAAQASGDQQAAAAKVQDCLERAGAGQDQEILTAAMRLLEAVHSQAPETGAKIGVDLQRVRVEGSAVLERVASSGHGVRMSDSTVGGDLKIGPVEAGLAGTGPKS
jgi:hypothetical protein